MEANSYVDNLIECQLANISRTLNQRLKAVKLSLSFKIRILFLYYRLLAAYYIIKISYELNLFIEDFLNHLFFEDFLWHLDQVLDQVIFILLKTDFKFLISN